MHFAFAFLLGSIMASSALCLAMHWDNKKRFIRGRSMSDCCKRPLGARSLCPIFSYLLSKGRCLFCQQPIPFYYFYTELAGALCFFFICCRFPMNMLMIYYMLLFSVLFLMSMMDLLYLYVPDRLQVIFFLLIVMRISSINMSQLLLFVALAIFLWTLFFLKPSYIGGADIKLLLTLTLAVEPIYFPYLLITASVLGILCLLIFPLKKLPFIPFISFSYLLISLLVK